MNEIISLRFRFGTRRPTDSIIIIIIIIINHKKYILKQPHIDELCRRCGKESETIQHITAACEKLVPTEYVKRHAELVKIIHKNWQKQLN
jgi:hypothetical protein